ncbi:MAG TPA: DUF4389 domain-containing protein [Acidimicrobiales bacterium]
MIGSILGLVGLALLAGGGALLVAAATQRDDGYFTTDFERYSSRAFAITSDDVDLGADIGPGDRWDVGDLFRVRLRVEPTDPGTSLFVGIARADDVERYIDGVAHDVIEDVDTDPFEVEYEHVAGDREPAPPQEQDIWVASVEGSGRETLEWEPEDGRWVVVLMNADATSGVVADAEVGVEIRHLWAIIGGILGAGLVLLAVGVILIVVANRHAHPPPAYATAAPQAAPQQPTRAGPPAEHVAAPETAQTAAAAAVAAPAPGAPVAGVPAGPTRRDPVALVGYLDEPLSRWLWLVKWILAIPHVIVLVFLWIAALVVTFIAGIAILFTGRYPRGMFDFTVGVLRWTWRVAFYATSALGTDRYPPFSLDERPDYPAQLTIAYPERLSRLLVLVKWWLLAIPHYIVLGFIGTGWWWGAFDPDPDGWWFGRRGGGLLAILVLVAGVRLLFTSRYPREMFALLMGLNRWVFRVAAYAMLMTDVYPPFRLDQGPTGREGPAPDGSTVTVT